MTLSELFPLKRGDCLSIVGSGGKTTLLFSVAERHRSESVLVSTTTKIGFPKVEQVDHLYVDEIPNNSEKGITLVCREFAKGEKLRSIPLGELGRIQPMYDLTLLECDGSARLPLKGWADHEPVVPDFSTHTIGIIPLWPVGKLVSDQTVHRIPFYRKLTGAGEGELITLEQLADVIVHPRGLFGKAVGKKVLLLNQIEEPEMMELARKLVDMLPATCRESIELIVAGSVQKDEWERIGGRG